MNDRMYGIIYILVDIVIQKYKLVFQHVLVSTWFLSSMMLLCLVVDIGKQTTFQRGITIKFRD